MLLKACSTTKPRVHAAFQVLCDLTSTEVLPAQQANSTAINLANRHGVHNLCALLCPEVASGHPYIPEQVDALAKQGGFG